MHENIALKFRVCFPQIDRSRKKKNYENDVGMTFLLLSYMELSVYCLLGILIEFDADSSLSTVGTSLNES